MCVCRLIYSQAWSVVLNYVKALHCPIHPREGGWIRPPVRVNGTITAASISWKTEIWFCKHRPLTSTPEHFLTFPLHNWNFYSPRQQGISNDTKQRISFISSSLQIIMNPGSCTLYCRINKVCLPLSIRMRHLVRTAQKSEICGQIIYVRFPVNLRELHQWMEQKSTLQRPPPPIWVRLTSYISVWSV